MGQGPSMEVLATVPTLRRVSRGGRVASLERSVALLTEESLAVLAGVRT
jgi:hypothetical protein